MSSPTTHHHGHLTLTPDLCKVAFPTRRAQTRSDSKKVILPSFLQLSSPSPPISLAYSHQFQTVCGAGGHRLTTVLFLGRGRAIVVRRSCFVGALSCLLGLGWAVAGGATIIFWGACSICGADGRRITWQHGGGSGEAADVVGFNCEVDVSGVAIIS